MSAPFAERITGAALAAGLLAGAILTVGPEGSPGPAADPAATRPPDGGPRTAGPCRRADGDAPLPEPGRRTRTASSRRGLDVLHYDLALDLRQPARGRLRGRAGLTLRVGPDLDRVKLDLVGLTVDSARFDGDPAVCRHDGQLLELRPAGGDREALSAGRHTVDVFYHGSPREGLVFGSDREGGRTVFSDNWPNRARWWFPSNDHPSDKATVRFAVRPPRGREVVANGRLLRRGDDPGERWVWETDVPIPVYTMVVGVADFRTALLGDAACGRAPAARRPCVAVTMWALPGDSAFGRRVLRRAPDMVDFYAGRFGPFPYGKLAHVESGTRFGGMENASAIFYAREPWARGRMGQGVVAHETAHQWFGDSVTPRRWRHLWISEGFATYFDAVYFGARDGRDAFRRKMADARRRYLDSDAVDRPVVDTTADLYSLLNANSYQKGAWVLHMLRGAVGDSAFFRGLRRYYRRHRDRTARTGDLRRAMEKTSGRELGWFFDQWLRAPGYPRLEAEWWVEEPVAGGKGPRPGGRAVSVAVRQTQPEAWPAFRLPTEVAVDRAERPPRRADVVIAGRTDTVRVPVQGEVEGVRLDPGDRVLKTLELHRRAPAPVLGPRRPSPAPGSSSGR